MLISLESAKKILRVYDDEDDEDIASLIASAAAYLYGATGHDWDRDVTPHPIAIHCMRALLIRLYDNRSDEGIKTSTLEYGLNNWITQLQVLAVDYPKEDARGKRKRAR